MNTNLPDTGVMPVGYIFSGFRDAFPIIFIMIISIMHSGACSAAAVAKTPESQPEHMEPGQVQQGSLLLRNNERGKYTSAPILHTKVYLDISGMIARARVIQSFSNQEQDWAEGIYVFPLPENAAVDHMRIKTGGRIMEGKIKERVKARKIYRRAREAGTKAALVEQERPNIFTSSVANIGPGETVVVEIEYQQSVRYVDQVFSLRFPLVITPRFNPGNAIPAEENLDVTSGTGWAMNTDQVPDASRITPPYLPETEQAAADEKINPVHMEINLDAGMELDSVSSLYHPVITTARTNGSRHIVLASESVPADRDFVLQWAPAQNLEPRAAVFTYKGEQRHYSMVMIMPPVAEENRGSKLAREITFIIDTSGSMGGTSIAQARASLARAIRRLNSQDRFNVIQFNSSMASLHAYPVEASPYNVSQALHYVNRLQAGGGTIMEPALKAALSVPDNRQFIQQIVFLTDGAVGNESALFNVIQGLLGKKRLFTVGIGSAPNSHFMRRAAEFGRGTYTYIGDLSEVDEKMQQLFQKLETPAMSHLVIDWPDMIKEPDVYPSRLPDLYANEPLLITFASDQAAGQMKISGQRGRQPWSASLSLDQNKQHRGVDVLWARNRIATLMSTLHRGGDRNNIRKQVVKTALEHHLVTKYTSLVAVDVTPARPAGENLNSKNIPLNLPHGYSSRQVRALQDEIRRHTTSGDTMKLADARARLDKIRVQRDSSAIIQPVITANMPQTATPSRQHMLAGLVMFLIALLLRGCYPRCSSRRTPA